MRQLARAAAGERTSRGDASHVRNGLRSAHDGSSASAAGRSGGRRRQRGQSVVELALTAPLLFLILFGIIDFGYVFNSYHEIRSASRDGARLAVVDNGCFPGGPNAACGTAAQQLAQLKVDTKTRAQGLANPGNMTLEFCYPTGAIVGTSNVTVTLSYPAGSITGFLGWALNNVTLRSTAVMRLEQAPTFSKDATCP